MMRPKKPVGPAASPKGAPQDDDFSDDADLGEEFEPTPGEPEADPITLLEERLVASGTMTADQVVVRIERVKNDGRVEGRVSRILEPRDTWPVGRHGPNQHGHGLIDPFVHTLRVSHPHQPQPRPTAAV